MIFGGGRADVLAGAAAMALLAGCGGGGGPQTNPAPQPGPTPSPSPAPTPTPTPAPAPNFDTTEYRRSNGAVAAQALAAYQAGATGANVIAAVIDSGVDGTNIEFAGRISPQSRDLTGNRGVGDDDGHGTEVSGILLAAKNDSGIQGVAFNTTLLSLRADTPGSCTGTDGCSFSTSAIAAGFDAATNARARVINLSLGGSPSTPTLDTAIARATGTGIVVVISAGNDAMAEVDPLARATLAAAAPGTVIVAGAVDANRVIADFSNRAGAAASSYLVTLGVGVRSFDNKGAAFLYSGTSEAAPVISGSVALLASAFPNLTGPQIVDLLLRTADDLGAPGTDPIYGQGALNLARAFAPVGTLSVGKVADPLALAGAGTLGTAFGDGGAGTTALGAVAVHDQYDRAYVVDIAATLRRESAGRLAAALIGGDVGTSGGQVGGVSVGFSAVGTGALGWRGDRLTGAERAGFGSGSGVGPNGAVARIVSGQAVVPLSAGRRAAFGFGQPLSMLLDAAGGGAAAVTSIGWAPLVTGRLDGSSLASRDVAGAAMAQRFGGWTASLAVGARRLGDAGLAGPIGDPARGSGVAGNAGSTRAVLRLERDIGALHLAADGEMLVERGALLGSRLAPVFGARGATTGSAALRLTLPLGRWTMAGVAQIGVTRADLTGNGLIRSAHGITATAASLTLARAELFAAGDGFSMTVAQPLRAAGLLELETGGAATSLSRLGPSGREVAFEAQYARPVAGGLLGLGLFWRHQPGHIADAAADSGGAVRYRIGF